MTLFSNLNRLGVVFICIAALSVAGCQDTATRGGGNGPVLTGAANASRVETPLPGDQSPSSSGDQINAGITGPVAAAAERAGWSLTRKSCRNHTMIDWVFMDFNFSLQAG